ncbi:MAG: transposase, partial [Deltaproteobacteria bacterium]|nr:transposase [Deltaproteobacteria bacterium]
MHVGLQRLYCRAVRSQANVETSKANAQAISQGLLRLGRDPTLGVHPDIKRLQGRLLRRRREFVYFITDPKAEGTNNFSERTLRAHAMSRARCGPARSARGAESYATNLTAVHTAEAHKISFEHMFIQGRIAFFQQRDFPGFVQANARSALS